ncbi:MAG TPA: cytochrome c [Chloroflexota bacterium]|nr:cytochrome c [Chloroflexota bacterium]
MKSLLFLKRSARWLVIAGITATLAALLPLTITMAAGDPVQGKALYQSNCASCHGPNGAGGIKIGSATSPSLQWASLGATYNQNTALIHHSIQASVDETGQPLDPVMPKFQTTLSDTQIDNIIAYLQTLGPATAPAPTMPKTGGPLGSSDLPWLVVGATLAVLAGFGLRRLGTSGR